MHVHIIFVNSGHIRTASTTNTGRNLPADAQGKHNVWESIDGVSKLPGLYVKIRNMVEAVGPSMAATGGPH